MFFTALGLRRVALHRFEEGEEEEEDKKEEGKKKEKEVKEEEEGGSTPCTASPKPLASHLDSRRHCVRRSH